MGINTKSKKTWLIKDGWIIFYHFSKDKTEMNFNMPWYTLLDSLDGATYVSGWSEIM